MSFAQFDILFYMIHINLEYEYFFFISDKELYKNQTLMLDEDNYT